MIQFKDIPLFSELNNQDLEALKNISIIKYMHKNEIVFYQGDEPKYLHILAKGESKIYRINNNKEVILHYFHAPTLLAERANLENINFPANCIMSTDGVIIKIEFNKFKELMKKEDICLKIMQSLLKKMTSLENVIDNITLDTQTRIAKFIYENPEAFETLKQHSIANILNIKPETLSRKLKKLKQLGIIENINSKIKIIDKDKLKTIYEW